MPTTSFSAVTAYQLRIGVLNDFLSHYFFGSPHYIYARGSRLEEEEVMSISAKVVDQSQVEICLSIAALRLLQPYLYLVVKILKWWWNLAGHSEATIRCTKASTHSWGRNEARQAPNSITPRRRRLRPNCELTFLLFFCYCSSILCNNANISRQQRLWKFDQRGASQIMRAKLLILYTSSVILLLQSYCHHLLVDHTCSTMIQLCTAQ